MSPARNYSKELIRLAFYKKLKTVNTVLVLYTHVFPCRFVYCPIFADFQAFFCKLKVCRMKSIAFISFYSRIRCKKFREKNFPCMYYHIGRCKAPCCKKTNESTYNEFIEEICSLLEGKGEETVKKLQGQMKEAAKKVVFLDEIPWMDAPKSNFVSALEHFWNGWAFHRNDIILVVCGSATSWIVKKIFKNRGGLHNRLSFKINLKPFTLKECEQYASARALAMTRQQILETYMILGGVPYYWSFLQKGKSVAKNII